MNYKEQIKKLIPGFLMKWYYFAWVFLSACFYRFPGLDKKIKIIGVTGTSGKSTTVNFITKILEESGKKVASISSIKFKIGDKEWENKYKMTMPGRFVIQRFLHQAKKAKCQFIVLEVTSEGIRQFRHKFINFDTAVFTNLTPEHIESHKGFENYRNEKLKLFKATKNIHVINIDDENSNYFLDIPANKKTTFSLIDFHQGDFNLNLKGEFNIMNALGAIAVVENYDIDFNICKKVLEDIKPIPGRMETISGFPFQVIVDYAHTPAQLEAVYKSISNNKICVLGSCGGGRDKWKRPVLGEIASKYCSNIIITNEDPYDESPMEIINQVAEKAGNSVEKILDRKEAIKKAISIAKPNDTVIITGKGSEPWMCIENGKKIPWDDRQIVKDLLNKK